MVPDHLDGSVLRHAEDALAASIEVELGLKASACDGEADDDVLRCPWTFALVPVVIASGEHVLSAVAACRCGRFTVHKRDIRDTTVYRCYEPLYYR